VAVLFFCAAAILATFFLKDVPMAQQSPEAPAEADVAVENEEDVPMVP